MRREARILTFLLGTGIGLWGQQFDLVLSRGRVIDPESGLDAIRDVGISKGKIAALSEGHLEGAVNLNATGLVISPGFIDLHSHGQSDENYRLKARDGVTTALEMEVGVNPVEPWYRVRAGKALINFGASSGHIPARIAVLRDSGKFLPRDHAVTDRATLEEQEKIEALVRRGLDEGALGIGLGIAYVPATTREEIYRLFRLAAERKCTVFVHMRNAGPVEPGMVDALQEVLGDSASTGASLHIVHITSMAFRQTSLALEMIAGGRRHGIDVTTEAYPYTAGMTALETAIFEPGWQERLGIGFHDLQWVATGERLTPETFKRYRHEGGMVILHSIPESVVREAIADPSVIIASDGLVEQGKGHPRSAGTYARVLGRYVREERALTLVEAIRKMSLLPARRLETFCPSMRLKGRLRVGADADVTVFDPATVSDQSTYEEPGRFSTGIRYVLVNGTLVVRDGELTNGVFPGLAIKAR